MGWMGTEAGSSPSNVLSLQVSDKEKSLADSVRPDFARDSESELVEDCKLGLLSAYERLYTTHGTKMNSIALNMLGNTQDAEDAVQDAFLKIYRSVNSFKGAASFGTWIYRVLVNVCYDIMRKKQRRDPEVPSKVIDITRT